MLKTADRQAYNRAYYERHKEALKARAKAHYQANKDAAKRRYLTNREDRLARLKARRDSSEGAQLQASQRRRYAANPGPAIARAHKRRALRQRAGIGTDRIAYAAKVNSIRSQPEMACYWCKRGVPVGSRHIDHIMPLALGGRDSAENICGACAKCNYRKGHMHPDAWRIMRQSPQAQPTRE